MDKTIYVNEKGKTSCLVILYNINSFTGFFIIVKKKSIKFTRCLSMKIFVTERRRKTKKADQPLDTNSERILNSIWAAILDTTDLHKTSHFFQLGGDEYAAIKVIRQCHQLGFSINISTLYSHPTLEALALVLDQSQLFTLHPKEIQL